MILFVLIFIFFLFFSHPVYAIYEPSSVANNKYGIHIAELTDLKDAADLVNSSGGDWGYVTLVIQDGDRNQRKWQELFNQMRRLHLIPLIRLATHPVGDSWEIPQKEDAKRWVSFLDSLVWPIENRYVILFNEPNHAKEWGNTVSPETYADTALFYAKALKEKSNDFFILPAGIDMSASTDKEALEGSEYIKRIYLEKPEFFSSIDGWTSHSYPNPGFSGSPYATGKGSIASFIWELQFLNSIGITKPYPVFITETGWTHNQGIYKEGRFSPLGIGNNMIQASQGIWSDPRIVAITPFLLNYQGRPFDNFSWKKLNSSEYFPHFDIYKKIVKTKGTPNQKESYVLTEPLMPTTLVTNSTYTFEAELTNTGQGILDPADGYTLSIEGLQLGFSYSTEQLPKLEPEEKGIIRVHVKTSMEEGLRSVLMFIQKDQKRIIIGDQKLTLIPPPSLSMRIQLGWKRDSSDNHAQVLIYDTNNMLIHKFQDVSLIKGNVSVTGLYGIIPGKKYRVVVLIPYYLPRQEILTIPEGKTETIIKRVLPFDFNKDGAFNIIDLSALLFSKPNEVFSRFY